jgi:hypothetical protein
MCLIIHREQGSNVPNDVLEYNRKKNPDGFGLAWRDDEGLHHRKYAPTDYDAFHAMLKRLDRNANIEYVAHYRFATHGPACERLSHPFPYEDENGEKVLVFHNGIIPISAPKDESDTSYFVEKVLSKLPNGWWNNPAQVFLVESAISYSRLLIMTATETVRLNERAWQKKGGILYSTDPGPAKPAWTPQSTPNVVKYTPPKEWTKPEKKHKHGKSKNDVRSTDSRNFGFEDPDDDDVQGWRHMGHWVESLDTEKLDGDSGDVACAAVCVDCNTMGEVYIIGGTTFIDISHGLDSDDEDDVDSLTMAQVYAN